MHTAEYPKTRFHFNSDFSGEVIIVDEKTKKSIEVLGIDLIDFILYYFVGKHLISKLEQLQSSRIVDWLRK